MIAQAGGLTYTFDPAKRPDTPSAQVPQTEGTPFDTPTPADKEIANVEGITNQYYNTYGMLKDYVTSMWQDLGIDVTKPDLTQPGGGQFFQAYQNANANLRMTAQDLVQQRKWQEEAMTKQMEGKGTFTRGFDPRKEIFSRADVAGFTSTALTEDVKNILDRARIVYSELGKAGEEGQAGRGAAQLQDDINRLRSQYEQKAIDDPRNAQYWQYQADALTDALYEPPKYAPRDGSGGGGTKRDRTLYEKPVVENAFYVPPSQVQLKVQNGQVYAFHPSRDESYGTENIREITGDDAGKIVAKQKEVAGRKMIGGKRYITFKPPFDDPKYDMEVTNFTADQSILPFLKNNPQFGRGQDFINEADERKMWAKDKSIPVSAVLDMQTVREGEANRKLIEQRIEEAQKRYDAEKKAVQDKFTKASGGDRITIPTAQGDLIFKKNSFTSGFEFMNPDLYETITNSPVDKDDRLSLPEIDKILEQTGAFENVIAGIGALDMSMQQESVPVLDQAVRSGSSMAAPITPAPSTKPKNW